MTRTAIYARLARENQGELDRQVSACHDYATRHGLDVEKVYRDVGAGTGVGSDLADLTEQVRRGSFDTVLTYDQSRLTRKAEEPELAAACREHGVQLVYVSREA